MTQHGLITLICLGWSYLFNLAIQRVWILCIVCYLIEYWTRILKVLNFLHCIQEINNWKTLQQIPLVLKTWKENIERDSTGPQNTNISWMKLLSFELGVKYSLNLIRCLVSKKTIGKEGKMKLSILKYLHHAPAYGHMYVIEKLGIDLFWGEDEEKKKMINFHSTWPHNTYYIGWSCLSS